MFVVVCEGQAIHGFTHLDDAVDFICKMVRGVLTGEELEEELCIIRHDHYSPTCEYCIDEVSVD